MSEVPPAAPHGQSRGTNLTGTAGEYFVAAELSIEGWLATVTIKNAPGTDVLAQFPESGRVVAIQTKTAGSGFNFQMSKSIEVPTLAKNQWVVLVKLHEPRTRPTFYVVPHNVLALASFAQHHNWLDTAGGKARKDSTRRVLTPQEFADYEDQWGLLHRPSDEAEPRLGKEYSELSERYRRKWFAEHHVSARTFRR